MKSFIYTLSERSRAGNVTATVYRIMRNRPVVLGITTWNTASYAGELPEIRRFLMREGEIPKKGRSHYQHDETYLLEQV